MAVASANRAPKAGATPPAKQIKIAGDPESWETSTIAWHFSRLDDGHSHWGWSRLKPWQWKRILRDLKAFEGLTWAQLKEQSGGRKTGTNHHSLPVETLASDAQKRLIDLGLDDCSSIFSLRLENTLRLYGIRDGRVLKLLWYDEHHGKKNGVCPTKKK
jgi:hypothetical protein